ncbi:hypothetical protein IT072_18890 [Leifsonia sp. ZF2019]|uniref:hypothetical protein n=1 Tax=Leifsonia sp. ZF2019 TaxID=2781978 RepID=UPI001CBD6645|nr:hypothetical protein [Leifsonia sp. ZF2019]UAJ79242.1 hypothetical protein IT072_18890 [Leifsonia sp. ZF2019]
MTTIDDSNNTPASTPPGYWFGEIESRLHDRMRSALAEQNLRRGGWRLLHTLTDGAATAEELADRLPRGRGRGGRGGRGHGRPHAFHDGQDPRIAHDVDDAARDGRGRDGFDPRRNHGDRGYGPHGSRRHGGFDARQAYGPDGFGPRGFRGHDDGGQGRAGDRHPSDPRPQGAWTYSRETWHAEPAFAPHGGRPDHDGRDDRFDHHDHDGHHGHHGHSDRYDYDAHHGEHDHDHDRDGHRRGHGRGRARQAAFERGFERGYAAAAPVAGPFGGPFAGPFGGPAGFRGARGFRGEPGFGFGPQHGPGWTRGHGRGPCSGDRRVARVERILADFTERGWVWFDGDKATLTDEGRAAHDAAFAKVREVRESLAAGISDEDYATTLATLETMARNLGWEPRAADDTAGDSTGDLANAPTDGATESETGDSAAS